MNNLLKSILLAALLSPGRTSAQIQIGSNEIASMNRAGKISKATLDAFKKTTTLFTLQYKDYNDKIAYEKAIHAVWTITPFEIIRPDEMGAYIQKGGYSFFSFGGFVRNAGSHQASSPFSMHLSYDLWLPEVSKKGKVNEEFLSRIQIYPDNKTLYAAINNQFKKKNSFSDVMISFIYNDAIIYNWGPGYLKGYLKTVNDRLMSGEERGPFSEDENKTAITSLKTDTLYVPQYVRIKFNMFTGAENEDDGDIDEDIKKAYPFPVKFVSSGELNNLILNGEEPIKYLIYTKSCTDKFINVFDSKNNELIYARYIKLSYNFKNKDLSKLAKAID